jgi:hypothetical protein
LTRRLPFDAFYFVYAGAHPEGGLWLRGNGDLGTVNRSWAARVGECVGTDAELIRRLFIHGHVHASNYLDSVPRDHFLTWVRDPVERVASHFFFWQRVSVPGDPAWQRFHEAQWSLAEFAEQDQHRNLQSKYLAGLRPAEMAFAGLVEEFDRGLGRLSDLFGVQLPPPPRRANVNPRKTSERYGLDQGVRRAIAAANDLDVALYEEVRALWE